MFLQNLASGISYKQPGLGTVQLMNQLPCTVILLKRHSPVVVPQKDCFF